MTLCLLGLGSNLKHPARQLRQAIQHLSQLPKTSLLQVAPFYRNPPWGKKTLPDYWNTVIVIQSNLTPQQLLTHCQAIETHQGRVRKMRYGARTLDIDILTFGARKLSSKALTLPHPHMHERAFVQVPLKQLDLL